MISYPFPWRFELSRYSELYLMTPTTESQVQDSILELLAAYGVDAVPIDAGGRKQRGRMMGAARSAGIDLAGIQNVKVGGAIPAGYADLEGTLAPDGVSLYIEVKCPVLLNSKKKIVRASGHASQAQLDFLLAKHRRGAVCLVAWGASDVMEALGPRLEANRRAVR